jgi:hypothetical protein
MELTPYAVGAKCIKMYCWVRYLREWSSLNEAQEKNFSNLFLWLIYDNMDNYKHFDTRFILIHGQVLTVRKALFIDFKNNSYEIR